jgi:exodeoxyribonuclease VII large subunit
MSRDIILSSLWVKGEISNFKNHYSGHLYFTLKDEKSLIKCVMFKSQASLLKFMPEDGLKVIIRGSVTVYERDGQYQLYAEGMQPDGLGSLHLAYEQLKKRLEAEGLFDKLRKKKIPYIPSAIGVITSSTGAVIKDILNITGRRFPSVKIKLLPVAVQGEQAPSQIARAIRKFNELRNVDVIIIARGGGSIEELWAFNDELVARTIFTSSIPIISAVGHETDFTITDFAADLRAPTPSAAAEMVVPDRSVLIDYINNLDCQLRNSLQKNLQQKRAVYERLMGSVIFKRPYDKVNQETLRLDNLVKYLRIGLLSAVDRSRSRFSTLTGRLDALSPLSVLSRGYGVVRDRENGDVIKSVQHVKRGKNIVVRLSDGELDCCVEDIKENSK